MPLAPGTPYRNPSASLESQRWEADIACMRSSNVAPDEMSANPSNERSRAEEEEEIVMGNLFNRRQSRIYSVDLQAVASAAHTHESWFDPSADLPLRGYNAELADDDALGTRHHGEVHVRQPHIASDQTCDAQVGTVPQHPEGDVEAGVFLTRREKKEWAILILVGSLSICALCGIIAGLAVTLRG